MTYGDVLLMGEREVYDLLFPEQAELEDATAQTDYDYMHDELQRWRDPADTLGGV